MSMDSPPRAPERLSTGCKGLDRVLGGGLFQGQVYVIAGAPGSGKTILANQMAYAAARRGEKVLYVTLMAESHAQILWQLSGFSFFDPALTGTQVRYLNAYVQLETSLEALRDLLRESVRQSKASLLVLDGVVSAELRARSETEYKRFVQDLQSWCGMVGCAAVLLTSAGADEATRPEYTMVDGVVLLQAVPAGMRRVRQVRVCKLRGSAFLEGDHCYDITPDGVGVYPRLEALLRAPSRSHESTSVTTGVPGLDALTDGGVESDSTTMVLGSSGSGKTIVGMQFLVAGARLGERCLHFGFYEDEAALARKGERLGLGWTKLVRDGNIRIVWQPAAEHHIDKLADRLLDHVTAIDARRVVIDGLVGFKNAAVEPGRLGPFFTVLSNELRARKVTTIITDETKDLLVRRAHSPTGGLSALCENIVFLCQVEARGEVERLLSVLKVRCSGHTRRFHRVEVAAGGLRVLGPVPGDGSFSVTQPNVEADPEG
ncbi:MAG: ATPase domain-containing protein [Polyangiaceae bacterium]